MRSRTTIVARMLSFALPCCLMIAGGCTLLGTLPRANFDAAHAKTGLVSHATDCDCCDCVAPCYGYYPTQWSRWPQWCEYPPMYGPTLVPPDSEMPIEIVPEALPNPSPASDTPVAPPSENPAEVRAYYSQAREVSVQR